MYEYVSKAEYKPYKEEIESIIKKVQKIMKTEYDTTFQFKLIGSANRHLVTKIKDGTMTNNATMTLRASFNEDIFSFLYLYLPPYEEQKKIGDLLYNIEMKMLANKKINDNLAA